MDNIKNTTNNIKAIDTDLEALRQQFPQCFEKDGKFNVERFKLHLKDKDIDFSSESYGMYWLGKSYARLLATDSATTLLKEDNEHNALPENSNSQNVLIKGDNLEVLKHLVGAYREKVKMIYIDPPYNTGSDGFVYQDDRKFTVKELRELADISEEQAKRILSFTQNKSNSHSAWLTFMYPRLYIAKQLLREDGVIFVSIDDNEVAQLRLLMDEIFGEDNFGGQIVWQTATDNNPTQIATEHEYVLCYIRNTGLQDSWERPSEKGKVIQEKYLELKELFGNEVEIIQNELRRWIRKQSNGNDLSGVSHYSYVDEKGVFYPGNSANTKPGGYNYDIIHPKTKKVCSKPEYGYRWTYETFEEAVNRNDVQWGLDHTTIPKIKKRLDTVTQKLKSYYYEDNRTTSSDLKRMFDNKKVFNNPKSVNFLIHIIKFVTIENSLILDFFAGSGTTGDAVMQLNAQDGGNRKYILVQIPEPIDPKKDKVAYDFVKNELNAEPTIFEITKERLKRAAKKIKDDQQSKQAMFEDNHQLDMGFKVFETSPIWENYDFYAFQFEATLQLFDYSQLTENDIQMLLTTWKTYDGIPLTQPLEEIALGDYTSYYVEGKLYLMHKGFTTDNLKLLLEKIDNDSNFEVKTISAFGYHFESKALRELAENVKSYNNKKNTDIDFIIRY